jgi:hypothetical protein
VSRIFQYPAKFQIYLDIAPAGVRVSQAALETVFAYGQPLVRVGQAPVEVLLQYAPLDRHVRLGQAALEVIYPFGCHTFRAPLPAACPVEFEPDPNTQPCADDTPVFP